jgi:DNA-directed RNA polymerase subunit RPC12/RpoP
MEIVTIRTFDNYFSANILLTRLRHSGIQCYLKDEYTVTIDPLLSNAIGGIKLVVNKIDEREANKMLRSFDTEYKNYITCPDCGSHDILLVPKQSAENMIAAIASWLFSSYAVSAENVYKCSNCGYQSKDLPESTLHNGGL